MDNLGSRIRKIRKGLKLNQLDFALKIGLKSATAISKYEDNTREPEIDILIKISNLGNISIDELVKGEYFEEDFKKGDQLGGRSYIKDNSALYGSPDALFTSDQNINIEEAIGKTYKVLNSRYCSVSRPVYEYPTICRSPGYRPSITTLSRSNEGYARTNRFPKPKS